VKGELRTLNLGKQKRKWNDHSTSSENIVQKKPAAGPDEGRPATSKEPCAKCGRTNHTTAECCVDTNKCMRRRSPDHSIATFPRRAVEKGVARPIPPPRQRNLPSKPSTARRAYIMSKKEAIISGTVVTGTLFLNSKPFYILFDSVVTH